MPTAPAATLVREDWQTLPTFDGMMAKDQAWETVVDEIAGSVLPGEA